MVEKEASRARTTRMSGTERREQLVSVGRRVFAEKGFDMTTVEEIAARAKVSKPIVYEHFGGKEGLYAVVVDREVSTLLSDLEDSLKDQREHPRVLMERAALAFLSYIDENEDGFRILVRDSPSAMPSAPSPPCSPMSRSGSRRSSPLSCACIGTRRATPPCTPRCSWGWWRTPVSGGWRRAGPRRSSSPPAW